MNNDQYIVMIKTVQIAPFRTLMVALKDILLETNITFQKDGIRIINMDKSQTILVHMHLQAENFEYYQCNKEKIIVGVNMLHLFKLINSIDNEETLSIYIEEKDYNDGIVEYLNLKFENKNIRIVQVALKVFKEISYRDKPDGIISIFDVNKNKLPKTISGPILIPDQIEKPGNLGTMIRTSKSFGINNILLSDEITDVYNPNVIRASIGHLFNSNISSGSNDEIIALLAPCAASITIFVMATPSHIVCVFVPLLIN